MSDTAIFPVSSGPLLSRRTQAHGPGGAMTPDFFQPGLLSDYPILSSFLPVPASPPMVMDQQQQTTTVTPPPSSSSPAAEGDRQQNLLSLPLLPHTPPKTPPAPLLIDHQLPIAVSVPQPVKKKRASKPKVRSGCITCKIRRVKCDEGKPTCNRCAKADIKCDGYVKDAAEQKRAQERDAVIRAAQRNKVLLPRPAVDSSSASVTPGAALVRANPVQVQIDTADVSYYDLFRHQLVRDLAGSTHSDFWSRIVMAESARDPCVKESVLAIGAIAQTLFFRTARGNTLGSTQPPGMKPWGGGGGGGGGAEMLQAGAAGFLDHHHKAALQHHLRAVSVYRQRIQMGTAGSSPRSVIIMTLLLIAFEFIQGNMKSVDSLMGTGMRLIEDASTLMRRRSSSRDSEEPAAQVRVAAPPREDEMDDIEHLLPCLSLMSGFTHFFNSHRATISRMNSTPAPELPQPGVTPVAKMQVLWGKFFTRAVAYTMRWMHTQMKYLPPPADAARERGEFLMYLRLWQSILETYLADPGLEAQTRRALEMIRIHRLIMYVLVSASLDGSDMAFDAHEDDFREMLRRTLRFMRADTPEEQFPLSRIAFTFAEGLTTPLTTIIAKCRNHDLRMQAAGLMRALSWRDGAWDGKALAVGKLGVVMLEERGMDMEGRIPAAARWVWTDAKWDLERREVVATYVRLAPGEGGQVVSAHLVLDIDNPPDACGLVGCSGGHDPFEDLGMGMDM
ncbi:c6 zinc finger domain-containing protein [Colletotrichum asianum]